MLMIVVHSKACEYMDCGTGSYMQLLPKFETVLLILSGVTSNASLSINVNKELPVTSGFI